MENASTVYGKAYLREYLAKQLGYKETEAESHAEREEALEAMVNLSDNGLLTEEEALEIEAFQVSTTVVEAVRMAFSTYSKQITSQCFVTTYLLNELIWNELLHAKLERRKIALTPYHDRNVYADELDEDQVIQPEDFINLNSIDPLTSKELFEEALTRNDLMARIYIYGVWEIPKDETEDQIDFIEATDTMAYDEFRYSDLAEFALPTIKRSTENTRSTVEAAVTMLRRYQFAADVIDAYLGYANVGAYIADPALESEAKHSVDGILARTMRTFRISCRLL